MTNHTFSTSSHKTIVFLSLAYHPLIGGAEKQAQLLAENWAAAGRSVVVITRRVSNTPHEEMLNGVKIIRIPCLWLPGLAWISFTTMALCRLLPMVSNIGCLIGVMLNPGPMAGALLSRWFGIPLILRPSAGGHGGNLQTLARSSGGQAKLSFLLGAAAYIVAMNQEVADELSAAGVPEGKIRLVPNGVDVNRFSPPPPDVKALHRRAFGLSELDPVVLYAGRLEKVKNLDGLLRAWKKIIGLLPQARLVLVGDGTQRQALEAQAQELGITSSIQWEGVKQDLVPYYQLADVFILPSHREGVSNAFLEAMACGLPPVASHVGGNREILSEFAPELLIDPGAPESWSDVLVPLLKDSQRRLDISRRARSFIEDRFSADAMKRHYEKLLADACKSYFKQPFPILAYHRVLPSPVYGVDTSVQEFKDQMTWLSKAGYRSISLAEFHTLWQAGQAWPAKTVVLTFDDGHREFYDHAVPILKQFNFTATVFINTGLLGKTYWVGGRRPSPVRWLDSKPADYNPDSSQWRSYEFMTWDQVLDLQRSGFEIGSHAVTHPFLTDLAMPELQAELTESKHMIEEKCGVSTRFFCYPSGNFDRRVQNAIRAAGYEGAVQSPSHDQLYFSWDNPMVWERIGIWEKTPLWKFKALVTGRYTAMRRKLPLGAWKAARSIFRGLGGGLIP